MAYDKAVCQKYHTNADMAVRRCVRCNDWWATNSPDGLTISEYCPTCVPLVFRHVLDTDVMAQRYSDHLDRNVLAAERADRLERLSETLLHGRNSSKRVPWCEQYAELRYLGYLDWEIAKHFGISNLSLLRKLDRYKIPVCEEFASLCHVDKRNAS